MSDIKDYSVKSLKKLSTDELIQFAAEWKDGHENRFKAEYVLRQKENFWTMARAWASLVLSIIALFISVYYNK